MFGTRARRAIAGRPRSDRWKFGFVYITTGHGTASATAVKNWTTPSSGIGKYASMTATMPSTPMSANARAWRQASSVVVAATPAVTGTRPRLASSTTSTTRRFCSQSR